MCIDGSAGLPVTVVGGVNANTWHTVVWWQWPRCGLLIYSPRLAPAQLPVLDHCFILSSYSGISQHFVSILEPTKQRQYLVIPQLAPASLGEAGSCGTWLCKNIHLPCKSFMQQGRQQTDFLFKQQSLRSWCLQMLGWMIYFAQVWPKCKRNYFPLPFRQKVVNRGSIGATTRPPVRATHSTQHTAEKLSRKSVF